MMGNPDQLSTYNEEILEGEGENFEAKIPSK